MAAVIGQAKKSIATTRQWGFFSRIARRCCDARLERAMFEVNRYR